jgi:hypothetical protein
MTYDGVTMPRGAKSRRATASKIDTITTDVATEKEPTVSTATDTAPETDEATVRELPFQVAITPAEDGYKPDRSPAGRKRIPSPFEAVLPGLKGKGWQNQPHDGQVEADDSGKVTLPEGVKDSNARVILRELSKAVKFLNSTEGGELGLGLDVNVTKTDVQFNIRDKQNRKPRTAPGGGDVSDGESDDDSTDEASGAE